MGCLFFGCFFSGENGTYFYPEFTWSLQKKKTDFICGFYTESEESENSFFHRTGENNMMREKVKDLSETKRLIIAAVLIIACIAANIGLRF